MEKLVDNETAPEAPQKATLICSTIDLDSGTFHSDKKEKEMEQRLERSIKMQEKINTLLKRRIIK